MSTHTFYTTVLLMTFMRCLLISEATLADEVIRVPGKDGDVMRITRAYGEGGTDAEALENAFADAVRQSAVNLVVANTTLLDTGDAFKDISYFNSGLITWYQRLETNTITSWARTETKRVVITCDVSSAQSIKLLENQGFRIRPEAIGSVDGKQLFAQIVSERRRDELLAKVLVSLLRYTPTRRGMLESVELTARKIEPRRRNFGQDFECDVFYHLSYNYSALTEYCTSIDNVLRHTGLQGRVEKRFTHGYCDMRTKSSPTTYYWDDSVYLTWASGSNQYQTFLDLQNVITDDESGNGALVLLTGFKCNDAMDVNGVTSTGNAYDGKNHIETSWVVYQIKSNILRQVAKALRAPPRSAASFPSGEDEVPAPTTEVIISFLSSEGKPIISQTHSSKERINWKLSQLVYKSPASAVSWGNALVVSFIDIEHQLKMQSPYLMSTVRLGLNDLDGISKVQVEIAPDQ